MGVGIPVQYVPYDDTPFSEDESNKSGDTLFNYIDDLRKSKNMEGLKELALLIHDHRESWQKQSEKGINLLGHAYSTNPIQTGCEAEENASEIASPNDPISANTVNSTPLIDLFPKKNVELTSFSIVSALGRGEDSEDISTIKVAKETSNSTMASDPDVDKINSVKRAVTQLMHNINTYNDSKDGDAYRYLDDMLILMSFLVTLDSIKAEDRDDLRKMLDESYDSINQFFNILVERGSNKIEKLINE